MIKESLSVVFNSTDHSYKNKNTGNKYTSVTTVINKYAPNLYEYFPKDKLQDACDIGTYIHKCLEDSILDKSFILLNNKKYKVIKDYYLTSDYENSIYSEFMVNSDYYMVAGMVDCILKENDNIVIVDFKTSKTIDNNSKNYFMYNPISHLPCSKFIKYSLQLSIYATIINREYGLKIKKLFLHQYSHSGLFLKEIECPYLKEDSLKLLEHWRLHNVK